MNYLRERNELENYLNFFEFVINPIQIIQHKICGKNNAPTNMQYETVSLIFFMLIIHITIDPI